MRLLSIYYTHKPGGFCKRLYRLINALAKAGHEVHYLTLDHPPTASISTDVCIHILPFPLRARRGLFFWAVFTLFAPLYVFSHAVRLRAERIVVFGAFYSAMSSFTTALSIPTVLFLRSLVFRIDVITGKPWLIRKLACAVEKWGMKRAARVVCMTRAMQQEVETFLGSPLGRFHVLPNDIQTGTADGSSPSPAPFRPSECFTMVCAGVLDARKNVSFLLKALSTLPQNLPPWQVVVAGDGPERRALEVQARSLGLTRVSFPGWVQELTPLLQASKLLVHPAVHEGVPNIVLEALGEGLPVLASDIPEHREVLGADGLLFALTDPQGLGRRLAELVQTPERYAALREASGRVAESLRFDWDGRAVALVQDPIDLLPPIR